MSEVRGRSWEDPMPKGRRPRGATSRPRSRAASRKSYPTSEARGGSREELPHIQDQEQKPGGPHAQRAAAKRS